MVFEIITGDSTTHVLHDGSTFPNHKSSKLLLANSLTQTVGYYNQKIKTNLKILSNDSLLDAYIIFRYKQSNNTNE